MGYQVKWVEEHLGVTRKALIGFEKKKLMPENKGGLYREYTEEDIDRIWIIRLLQGMGYTLNEIKHISEDEEFDFETSLGKKIKQLEKKKEDVEHHLGYAKYIKMSGRVPTRPREMGSVKFEDFQENAYEKLNLNTMPNGDAMYQMIEQITTTKDVDSDVILEACEGMLQIFEKMEMNEEHIYIQSILPKQIVKRQSLGASHPEVQLIVKMIYESLLSINEDFKEMTEKQFARFFSSNYMGGDVAVIYEKDFGKDGCAFIAEAYAIFGGFKDYEAMIEEECNYGKMSSK